MKIAKSILAVALSACAAGCSMYRWTSDVPEDKRAVFVATFRNESEVTEIGNVVTRQILREFQREGTFKISSPGDCALEIQGVMSKNGLARIVSTARDHSNRRTEYRFTVEASVSFIDKKTGKVLVNDRKYVGRTTFYGDRDILTHQRDASGRLAEDIARQVVDDALTLKWE
jgi:hypothetical protein